MAVTVRALATNQLTRSNTLARGLARIPGRAAERRERSALVIGIGVALVFGNPTLGAVIARR